MDIPPSLRDHLLTNLFCTSPDEPASSPSWWCGTPGFGDLLAELEADDDLRARVEIELLNG